MVNNKHIFLILIWPFLIAGVYLLFESYFNIKPSINPEKFSIDEKIIIKYLNLEKELQNYPVKQPDTKILNIIIPNYKSTVKTKIKTSTSTYKLRYIIITSTKKVALINDKIVTIGDKINGAVVIDIKKECVIIKTKKGKKCIYID
jgi:hypothetical protein